MSSIRTMCPYCISPVDLDPPEILLLPAPAPACGSYAYYCGSCQRVTVAAVSRDAFTLLVNAGVRVEHGDPTPDPPPARPLTVDDPDRLPPPTETRDWFSRLR